MNARDSFNDSALCQRADLVHSYSNWVDFKMEDGYIYHLYDLFGNYVAVLYDTKDHNIEDIWMLDQREVEVFADDVNIDDLWQKNRRSIL